MTQAHKVPDPEEIMRQMDEEASKEETKVHSPEYSFDIDVEGEHGTRWKGKFLYRVPTLGERIMIGRVKAEYLPKGADADAGARLLSEMVAYLGVTLREKPSWFKPNEMFDETPLATVYGRCADYERRFHGWDQESVGVQEGSGSGGEDRRELEPAGDDGVGRKVQPPAQRSETIISHSKGGS